MDFLNKAYTQIVDLVRSMTPAARLTAGLLAGVIVMGLAFLFRFQSQSADDYLLGGRPFMASELTAVQRALSQAALKNWELEGNRIKIPSGQKDVYIAALAENDALPTDWNAAMDEAVKTSNPFRSRHEIDLTIQRAKQKELSLVIGRFRNVEQAQVMFDEVEQSGFRRQKLKTASVAVQTSGVGLEEAQQRAIRNLLATSYAGLDRANVAIVDTTTGNSYTPPTANGEGGENTYAAAKRDYESVWQKKIYDRLSMIPGVNVGVNVELQPEMQRDTTTVKVDPKPVPLSNQESTLESTTTAPSVQGRPGANPNGVADAQQILKGPAEVAAAAPAPKSSQNESKSEQHNAVGYDQTVQRYHPLVPEKVKATIDVPASYYVKIWREKNPTPAGQPAKDPDPVDLKKIEAEERKRIEEAVTNLLPSLPAGINPYPLVVVTTYTDIPLAPLAAETLTNHATTWFASNWRMLGMIVVGLAGLGMLRSMLRSAAPQPGPGRSASAAGSHALDDDEEEQEKPTDRAEPILVMRRKMLSKGPNLRDELRQLVKEDPDAAANVLRGWIGDVA